MSLGRRTVRAVEVLVLAIAAVSGSLLDRAPGAAQGPPVQREILALIDSSEAKEESDLLPVRTSLIHTLAEMPLNHLGMKLHYLDVQTEPLPSDVEMQRYFGIISWFGDDRMRNPAQYLEWFRRQVAIGKRVIVLGGIGAAVDSITGAELDPSLVDAAHAVLGLTYSAAQSGQQTDNPLLISVRRKVPEMVEFELVEFERTLDGEVWQYEQFRSTNPANQVYLTLNRVDIPDGDSDVVVTGPWGGFVMGGYDYYDQPRTFQKRWRINSFRFFEEALGVKGLPRPDVSTLNGSRVLYTHVDGDGFNNITEIDYASLSAEVLLQRLIRRYDLPFTISIVVNDIDPRSLGGERQMRVAREIFAQPNVEPASHTFTHPFDWSKPVDLDHEIDESVQFLNQRVASPDRPVQLLLWSGSTNPQTPAVARSDALGLLNINGGDGRFDAEMNSYANVAPLTTQVGDRTQYYTSNSNDNIYAHDWTGPYYGLRNVIQTWDKTESPRRIGALNVYYHIFTGERWSAVKALEEVYDYALTRDIAPVFTTDYIRMARGFMSAEIVREGTDTWRVRNYGLLRTFRFDDENRFPDLARSTNVIGYWQYQGSLYIFLGEAPESLIALTSAAPNRPYVALASHRIFDWQTEGGAVSFRVEGVGRKKVVLANLPREAELTVAENAGAERRLQLRTDARGSLAWSSEARGPIRVTVVNATAAGGATSTNPAGSRLVGSVGQ
jgi:polysaccharide biosynthesis protein PelA